MNSLSDKSTFLIKSSDNQSFGTGFVVKKDSDGSYLVTCSHVVEECREDFLEVAGKKAELLYQGSSDSIDLAVIYVKGFTDTEALNLCSNTINKNLLFEINGFKAFKRESYKLEKLTGSIKKISKIRTPNRSIKTYELSIEEDDRIEKGYSGSAVVLKGSNIVIAIASERNKNVKDAYAIPIAYLKEIWEEMPKLITCEDEIEYKGREKISFLKKIENQRVNIIGGVVVVALLTGVVYSSFQTKEVSNRALTDKSLELIIKPYQEDIAELKEKLKNSNSDEDKIKYITLLEKANEEKAKKDKEIAKLKELIDNAKYKIVKEATVIFEKEGIEKALAFLQTSSNNEKEKLLKENMKEMAEKYRLEAQLLLIQNRYKKAKEAYEKALQYDNNVKNLFDYAYFLQSQNYFSEAISSYEKLLIEQRALAKTNPKVYNDDVAGTLNNLGLLYSDNNQMKKAEKSYNEALTLRRKLAKTNPKIYTADVGETLNNLGILYNSNNQMKKAEEAYNEALTLRRALAKTNPKVYNSKVAGTLNNLAIFYYYHNQRQKAKEAYEEALRLYRALAKNNPKVYNSKVAAILNNLAVFYSDNNQMQNAEEAYGEALRLYRALAKTNPKVYNSKVAGTLNNLANLYRAKNQMQKAEELYSKALTLRRALAKNNPQIYNSSIARTLSNLGMLYYATHRLEKAKETYSEALTLVRVLAKNNPKIYNLSIIKVLNNLGSLYKATNQMQKAEEVYSEALTLVRAKAKNNPNIYNADVAMILSNLGNLYKVNNQIQKEEEAYVESLIIRKELAKINPKIYNADVAMTLYNLAILYSNNNEIEKASEAYSEALILYRTLVKKNPKIYSVNLVYSLMNFYQLNNDIENLNEAEEILKGFKGFFWAEQLLKKIKKLRKNPKKEPS